MIAQAPTQSPHRGCIFYSFGNAYALRTLVAVFSLRQVYQGPVSIFLAEDSAGIKQKPLLEQLGCQVNFVDYTSQSEVKHRIFLESPYETSLVFDSDLIFLKPIDGLWLPIEEEGLLVTRFYPAPYGVDGTPGRPGWASRMAHLESIRDFVAPATYAAAVKRLIDMRIDINVGVMGISKPLGNDFLFEWADAMERARSKKILLLDEMLTVALTAKHRHFLADERWNCPADEFFRRTNLADANIIHFFADGCRVHGIRLGRNPSTWAGKKWYEMYLRASQQIDLKYWEQRDPKFMGSLTRAIRAHLLRRL